MEKEENLQENSENSDQQEKSKNDENETKSNLETADSNKEENKELSAEDKIKELEDKLIRTFAEMENQRRRFEKEKGDAFEYGGFSFAKETLNLIDNLERSTISLENDEKLKNTDALKKAIEHLDIIYKDMISILKKSNIEEIKSIDQKLDPNLHQAMLEIEDENKEPGTVVKEIQKGFMMKDRLLRPSLVAISKKPIKGEEKPKVDEKDKKNQPKTGKN